MDVSELNGLGFRPVDVSGLITGSSSSKGPKLDSIRRTLSSNLFRNRLEKHLDDVHKGRGYLSKEVNGDLSELAGKNADLLSTSNPKSFRNYLTYLSALTYDQRARFVNGVAGVAETVKSITA